MVVFDDATGLGVVSVTNYAQSSLGDVVYVELPTIGTDVAQGGTCCILLTTRRLADRRGSPQTRLALLRV